MKKIGHEEAQKIELEILTAFAQYSKPMDCAISWPMEL